MATTTASAALSRPPRPNPFGLLLRPLGGLATAILLIALGLGVTAKTPHPSALFLIAAVVIGVATAWFLINERYEWSLALLVLYLGLADGYLKLRTGSSGATLIRDLLLYAIVVGALVRAAVRHQAITLPPLSGWVIAWILVVVVQVANPHDGTLVHSIASFRPHLEFVPLFFLGYLVMRSKARLRAFLALLLVVGAANGIVGLIQLNLTPGQLAAWGPGYAKAINGEGSVSQRGFVSEDGVAKNRPFGLGGDSGFGGSVGFVAVPAVLALLTLPLPPLKRLAVAALSAGVVLAVFTSEARTVIIAAIIAALAYAGLTITSRLGTRALLTVGIAFLAAIAVIGVLVNSTEEGSFSRYNTITSPSEAITTAYNYRSSVIAQVPKYIVEIPFGGGFGSKGPAGGFGGANTNRLNAESEPTFLMIEVGVLGLAVMLGFNLTLFRLALTRIRFVPDRETRLLLAAIAAPLFAIFAGWFAGIATATVPAGPYLWFAAGVLSYWLLGEGSRRWSNG